MVRTVFAVVVLGVVAGCAVEPHEIYLQVDIRPGTIEQPRFSGTWSTGWCIVDERGCEPLGVFTLRIQPDGASAPGTAASAATYRVDPVSRCAPKSGVTCADGLCLTELVQNDHGLCLLEIQATTTGGPADTCWYLGTFSHDADNNQLVTPAEQAAIDRPECGGTY